MYETFKIILNCTWVKGNNGSQQKVRGGIFILFGKLALSETIAVLFVCHNWRSASDT